jgi:RND family efflux transporter MFP subunit
MTRNRWLTIAAATLGVAVVVTFVLLRRPGGEDAAADPSPTAVVTVVTVRSQPLDDVVTVYGVVQADPAGVITIAAPKAVIVSRVLVRSGETVAAGQPLVEVANAPGAELAYRQAADAAAFAQTDMSRVQRLYDERLAASDQLNAAKKVLADAQSALVAQQKQGSGRSSQTIAAPRAAIVTTVSAAPGDHVAQDAPLMVLAGAGAATVKLGLEPTAGRFVAGQAVTIRPVFGGPPIPSRIAMVGRAADQTTKTLDAIVPLNGAALPIGAAVQGDVVTGRHVGLVAPRAAVVFDETGPHLFTIAGGKAHRIFVKVGLDLGEEIEVIGPIMAGAAIAVEGAYELQDGMAVKVRGK